MSFKSKISMWLVVALIVVSCSCKDRDAEMGNVSVMQPRSAHATGYVEPEGELRRLSFRSGGVIARMDVEVGDMIEAGGVLAVLDDSLERRRLTAAEALLALAEARRDQAMAGAHPDEIQMAEVSHRLAEIEMDYRERERERLLQLRAARDISGAEAEAAIFKAAATRAKVEEAEAAVALLKNQVRPEDRLLAEAEIQVARAEVEVAREQLRHRSLIAPGAGTVLEIIRRQGEAVSSAGDFAIIFAPAGTLEVRAEVDEHFATRLMKGTKVTIRSRGSREFTAGTIRLIKPLMGRKTVFTREATERMDLQVIEIRVELADPPPWPIGLEVDVEIHGNYSEEGEFH